MKTWRLTARILWVVGLVITVVVVIVTTVALHLASQSHSHLSDSFSLTMAILTGIASVLMFVSAVISEIVRIVTTKKKRKEHSGA